MTLWKIPDAETLLWQDVNPRTGTRLDCPRPPDNKWAADVEVDYLDPQQMSPRFLPRRSRTDSTPGTVLRVSIVRLILQQLSCAFLVSVADPHKLQSASSFPSVWLPIHVGHSYSYWTDAWNWYWQPLWKSVLKSQIWLKSGKMVGHKPKYLCRRERHNIAKRCLRIKWYQAVRTAEEE